MVIYSQQVLLQQLLRNGSGHLTGVASTENIRTNTNVCLQNINVGVAITW